MPAGRDAKGTAPDAIAAAPASLGGADGELGDVPGNTKQVAKGIKAGRLRLAAADEKLASGKLGAKSAGLLEAAVKKLVGALAKAPREQRWNREGPPSSGGPSRLLWRSREATSA